MKFKSTGGAGGSVELFTGGRESEETNPNKGCFYRLYEQQALSAIDEYH